MANKETKNNGVETFGYFTTLSSLYVAIVLLTIIMENKVVFLLPNISVLVGTLVLPFSYALSDIITEVYGYHRMKRLVWISMLILYLSAMLIYCIIHLPSKDATSIMYNKVFSLFLDDVLTYSIAAALSIFLNAYILAKWKILLKGRFFWLRSLGATCIGEAIFIVAWALIGFSYKFPITMLLYFMLISYIYKLAFNLVMIYPTAIVAAKLKKIEGPDVYEPDLVFNPFKLESV